jgi:hypothetical protein
MQAKVVLVSFIVPFGLSLSNGAVLLVERRSLTHLCVPHRLQAFQGDRSKTTVFGTVWLF